MILTSGHEMALDEPRLHACGAQHSLDSLELSPQCGFASVSAGNLLSADEQRRKLELVVATARKIWG